MNQLIEKAYNIKIIEIKKLNGYENENYLIKTINNKFIFKKYPYSSELESIIHAENETLLFLSQNNNQFPNPINTAEGLFLKVYEIDGEKFICRMLSFLEGEMLGSIKNNKEIFESFGFFCA
mgnify:FL=1